MHHHTDLAGLLAYAACTEDARGIWFLREPPSSAPELTPFDALARTASRFGGRLQRLGLEPGSRVAFILPAAQDALPLLFGALRAGIVPVPLAPPLSARELAGFGQRIAYALHQTRTHTLITSPKIDEHLAAARGELDTLARSVSIDTLRESRDELRPVSIHDSDTALIFWSGERPVARSHREWLEALAAAAAALSPRGDDVFVSWLNPFGERGLGALLLALYCKRPLALLPEVVFLKRPRTWLEAVARVRGTISFAPADGYRYCLESSANPPLHDLDLSSWRIAGSTNQPLARELTQGFARALEPAGLRPDVFDTPAARLPELASTREDALAYGQRALWFLAQLTPDSRAYNVPLCLRIRSTYDLAALQRALACSLQRHAALRTVFPARDGLPYRKLLEAPADWLEVCDASGLDDAAVHARLRAELARRFDLERGPLFIARLFTRGPSDAYLLLVAHHLCVDALSFIALGAELHALYPQLAAGAAQPDLPPPAASYDDFVRWQGELLSGPEGERLRDYWREQLRDVPVRLDLPSDRPRPPLQSQAGARLALQLPAALLPALRAIAEQEQTTLFGVLLAAYHAFLYLRTGQRELVAGTTVAGRTGAAFQGVIGCFINTLPIRARVTSGLSFEQLVRQVRGTLLAALDHQDLPFAAIVEQARLPRDPSRLPLCQVMFQLQTHRTQAELRELMQSLPNGGLARVAGLDVETLELDQATAQCDLRLDLRDFGGQVAGFWEYDTDLFDAQTIERWSTEFLQLVAALVEAPAAALDLRLPPNTLEPAERGRVLETWNDTRADYPDGRVQHAFERQASLSPDAVALTFGGSTLRYAELNRAANRLAHHLRACGVGRDVLVGVCMDRSLELVIALLGVLKAGGAYVPLDPTYPTDRLSLLLRDAQPALVIAGDEYAPGLRASSAAPVLGASELQAITRDSRVSASDPDYACGADDLAYVIYTSGSTGVPKGVAIPHAGLWNRLCWMQAEYQLGSTDCALHKTPYSFDVSVWEFFWPLMTGARLAIARPEGHKDTRYLLEEIERQRVTTLHFVPSMLQAFLDEPAHAQASSLRRVICSGEALPYPLLQRFFERLPHCELHNLYGPTEASIDVTHWRCQPHPRGIVPIGRPIANTQIYLLDERHEPVPIGATGELYIGGAGLARGYHRRPELTAERFIQNPIAGAPSPRLYKTGDLARSDPDGVIEYLGRSDDQIKLRGFRIELGELEAVLDQHPSVKRSVALLRDTQLEACVVPQGAFDAAALRSWLGARLPAHMLPSRIFAVDAIPLTHSGKADRKALLSSSERSAPAGPAASPRTPLEQLLVEVWRDVLGLREVSIHASFFELGGDSIRSLQLRARARQRGVSFEVSALFAHQTIADLAAALEHAPPAAEERALTPFELLSPSERVAVQGYEDAFPATQLQLGMLYHSRLSAAAWTYHDSISLELEFDRPFEGDALREALAEVMRSHPLLRASFELGDYTRPLTLIAASAPLPLTIADLRTEPAAAQLQRVQRYVEADKYTPYRLDQAPLFRLMVHLLTDTRVRLTLSFHHAILDGWSAATLQRELLGAYLRRSGGADFPQLPAPRHGFAAFVALEEQAVEGSAAREYFQRALAGAAELVSLPRWPDDEPRRPGAARSVSELRPKLSARLHQRAAELRAPLKSLLLAAHVRALAAVTGSAQVSTGCVTHGRPELADADRILGLFLNTLPLAVSLGAQSWAELIAELVEREREVFPHRRLPLREIQRALGREQLFETAFNFVSFHVYADLSANRSLRVHAFEVHENTGLALLANFVQNPHDGSLALHLEYDTQRVAVAQAEQIARAYLLALEALATDPACRVRSSNVLGSEERALLDAWQDGGPAAAAGCVHDLVQSTSPEAIAAQCGDRRWSYAQLDRQANQLARRLRAAGAQPGDVIAICAEPCLERVAGVLGVLRAGCAYLPLDPSFPPDRLGYMLDQAAVKRALVTPAHATEPFLAGLQRLSLDARHEPESAPPPPAAEPGAAYVIYTSGSTGRPKGVLMPHAPLANLIAWQRAHSRLEPGAATAHCSAFSFDVSFQELFATWAAGGRLVIVPERCRSDTRELIKLLAAERVARLFVPVVLLHQLCEVAEQLELGLPALREVITAGEQLEITPAVRAFFRRHPGCRLENQYGPSETHVATAQPLAADPESWPRAPAIGRPLPGVRTYVLDAALEPAPIGVPGELYLAGACVATGYVHAPELTDERFGSDRFVAGARMYRTGDLARWLPDGTLEFLGRRDGQVKVRGYRVELAEVEAAILAADGGVRRVAVVQVPGRGQLAAFVVCARELDAEGLRREIGRHLLKAMVPDSIAQLEALPLTPSGKLDRRALVVRAGEQESGRGAVARAAPEGGLEEELCAVFREVLEVGELGVTEDFFELGGDSLRAVRLMARVQRRFGLELPIAALLEAPSVRQLAHAIQAAQSGKGSSSRAAVVLQRGAQGEPALFCVHPVGGNVLCYMPLARRLGRACVALQARGLDGRTPPLESIPELAAAYAREIVAQQPEGRLHFAGWSFGGMVALEIARQLREAGREIAPLLVMDTIARVKWQIEPSDDDLFECVAMELLGAQLDPGSFAPAGADRSARFEQLLAAARARGLDTAAAASTQLEHVFRVIQANIRAAYSYQPAAYGGEVILLRCLDPMPERLRRLHDLVGSNYDATDNGWGELCPALQVVPVRGDHLSLVFEPHVAQVAEVALRVLREREV